MRLSDSHFHLTDDRIGDRFLFLRKALEKQIVYFLEAGVDLVSWNKQIQLSDKIKLSQNFVDPEIQYYQALGLHPYRVAELSPDDCHSQLNELSQMLQHSSVVALGETGLDFREKYLHSEGLQIEIFEQQIEMAKVAQKPLVLHVVKAHEEALKILEFSDLDRNYLTLQKVNGQVHAFNSSYEVAERYLNFHFLISIGGAVTFGKNQKLREAVKKIPLDKILLESDSPDQTPSKWPDHLNHSCSILQVAQVIAEIKGLTLENVAQQTTSNFKKMIGQM